MPKYSIIICAYNVARFLEKALHYASYQIFRDIEIIIVDDGSTDGKTPTLCDKLAETDRRIKVIHKNNGGLGSARNAGIDVAAGEYIMFYDADDILPLHAVKVVNEKLSSESVDVLMFGYEEHSERYNTDYRFSFSDKLLIGEEICDNYVKEFSGLKFNNGFAWNKVYRRQFLLDNNLRFGTEAIQQDEPFNLKVYRKASSIRLIPDILYGYIVYDTGNNRARYIPDRIDIYRNLYREYKLLVSEWNLSDVDFEQYICKKFINDIICALTYNFSHKNCKLSFSEKNIIIKNTFSDSDVVDAVKFCHNGVIQKLDFVPQMYFYSIYKKSLLLFYSARCAEALHNVLACTYHKIRGLR